MSDPNKLIVVDTNCLVRIYFSDLRPILGKPVSGYTLKTLSGLAQELKNLASRRGDLYWLTSPIIQTEVEAAAIQLTRAQTKAVDDGARGIQQFGNGELLRYCQSQQIIKIRALHRNDAKALSAALELGAALATDEWPLRYVADLYDGDDEGNPLQLFSSVELIELLEREGQITRAERIKIYADWLRNGESLLRETPEIYQRLFNEKAPTAQG